MNFIDDAKVRIEEEQKQLEIIKQKQLDLAEAEQKFQETIVGAVDMHTTPDETGGPDVSIGAAILGK
ncbi:hypothetical protein KBC03_03960 [Patescibacteria group bacterium]|nr:hypothetical protein [Patescibacteria group bacterium]